MDTTQRWDEFSDDELRTIGRGLVGVCDNGPLEWEVRTELRRRRDRRNAPAYQGPGLYTDTTSGTTLRVVGRVTIDHVPCLLVGQSVEDPNLWSLPADRVEGRDEYGRRRFTFSTIA